MIKHCYIAFERAKCGRSHQIRLHNGPNTVLWVSNFLCYLHYFLMLSSNLICRASQSPMLARNFDFVFHVYLSSALKFENFCSHT